MATLPDWSRLERKIGVRFAHKEALKHAFIHRSYLNETNKKLHSNERLEFLGDAVLEFIASDYLYQQYPTLPEGMLTNIRSSIVKTTALADVARQLELGSYLLLSRGEEDGGGRDNTSLLADVFEALLGSIYLEHGVEPVRQLLQRFLFPQVADIIKKKTYQDYKSKLQELLQEKRRQSPNYHVYKTAGKDHQKTFWIHAALDKQIIGRGSGKSKQEAEQQAAKNALEENANF